MKKRNRLEIMKDLLTVLAEKNAVGVRPTRLLYKSNLSHQAMTSYLKELKEKGLIEERVISGKKHYFITPKGFEFLNRYKSFLEFVESFDLSEG